MSEPQVIFQNEEKDFYVDAVHCYDCGRQVAVFQRGGYPGDWAKIAVLCPDCYELQGQITEEDFERIHPDTD